MEKRTKQFGAYRLLTWKSPIDLVVLGVHGKTLKADRKIKRKITRERQCPVSQNVAAWKTCQELSTIT
jgi:hypothetical protein